MSRREKKFGITTTTTTVFEVRFWTVNALIAGVFVAMVVADLYSGSLP